MRLPINCSSHVLGIRHIDFINFRTSTSDHLTVLFSMRYFVYETSPPNMKTLWWYRWARKANLVTLPFCFRMLIIYISPCDQFLQGVSIALLCKPCTSYDRQAVMSVRPSVCPSVTRWHWVKTTRARITKSSPTDSPRTLVFGIKNSSRNSKGFTSSEGVKWEWGRGNSQFSANNSPYLRNGAR